MGQSLPNTILKEQAKYYIKKVQNPIQDASEINSCLHLTTMLDQMSLDISNTDYIISSITMNPLSFDPQVSQICKKEYQIKCESKIIIKQEKSPEKRNELLNGSFGSSLIATQQIQIPKHQNNEEEEENFTDMEYISDNSMQIISQDFAKLKKDINQADLKSYIQDDRFWQPNSSVPFILQPKQSPKDNQLFHRIVYKSQNQQDKQEQISNNNNNSHSNSNRTINNNNTNNYNNNIHNTNHFINKKNIQQFSNKQFTTTIQPPPFDFSKKNHSSPQQSESMREKFNRLMIETQSNQKKQQYFNYAKPQTQKGKMCINTDFATDTENELVKQLSSPKYKNSKPPQAKYLEGTSYAKKKQKFQSPQPQQKQMQMWNVQHSPVIKSPNRLSSLEKAREQMHSTKPNKLKNQELKQLQEKIEQLKGGLQGNRKSLQEQTLLPVGQNLDAYQDYEGSIDLEKLTSYQESLN